MHKKNYFSLLLLNAEAILTLIFSVFSIPLIIITLKFYINTGMSMLNVLIELLENISDRFNKKNL
jgi:hypothetical protein